MTDSAQSSVASQGKVSSLLQRTKASFSSGGAPRISGQPQPQPPVPGGAWSDPAAAPTTPTAVTSVSPVATGASPSVPRAAQPPAASSPPTPTPTATSTPATAAAASSVQTATTDQSQDHGNDLDLDLLDQALSEVEATVAPAAPQAIGQAAAAASLNPTSAAGAAGAAKERLEASKTPDTAQLDSEQQLGVTQVEQERNPELSPEVEAYLQKIQDHQNAVPQEIVMADDGQALSTKPALAQPVIVLPITEEIEDQGKNKSPKFSVRWLVEWSRKIMKVFSGKVVYRTADER